MAAVQETIDQVRQIDVDQYKYGFETTIEVDKAPKGLSEDIVRFISAKKNEPEWMLEWRLDAYQRWRRFDSTTLALGMDSVNRLFSNDNPLLRAGRDLGLGLVNAVPGLRRRFMRQAAGLQGEVPRLLTGRTI